MDRFAKLVAALACAFAATATHAGYAQLAPPPGWSGGASGGQFNYGAAANSATIANGTVRTNAALNVAGRAVTVPVSMRFAANAGRVAATASFANPGWFLLAGIVVPGMYEAYQYYKDNKVEIDKGVWKERLNSQQCIPNAECVLPNDQGFSSSLVTNIFSPGDCAYKGMRDGTFVGYWCIGKQGSGEGQLETITLPKFVEIFSPKPIPNILPEKLPIPLPVELPIINPSPGLNPQPQPLFIPTGNPVRNPNYNPQAAPSPQNQPFLQPGVRVVPAPTPSNPFQVDLQPVERPQAGPEPLPESEQNPDADPDDKPKEEDSKSLCEKHPDILACQNLDEPKDQDLPTKEKPISITPDSGWGADNAACPAPKMLQVQGRQIAIPYDLFCTYMQGMRPIIIAMAWLSAAFILIGARESS